MLASINCYTLSSDKYSFSTKIRGRRMVDLKKKLTHSMVMIFLPSTFDPTSRRGIMGITSEPLGATVALDRLKPFKKN